MSRRTFILVFPSDALWLVENMGPIKASLDTGDDLYALDGNIAFIRSAQDLESLLQRLQAAHFQDRQFLLTEITDASRAGNMPPMFWNLFSMKQNEDVAA